MNGVEMGPLRIYVTSDPNKMNSHLWEVTDARGTGWYLGQIPVPGHLIENFVVGLC